MKLPKAVPDELVTRIVSLNSMGISGPAWTPTDAIRLLHGLDGSSVAVLGGDIYVRRGESIEHAYANWHTERLRLETLADYAARSQRHALEYLTKYPAKDGESLLVGLVMSEEPTAGL